MSADPLTSSPPATRRRHLRSDDLDEVLTWTARDSSQHSRVVHGRGALGFEATVEPGTAVDVGRTRIALARCLRGSTPRMCLHIPRSRFSRYTFGRELDAPRRPSPRSGWPPWRAGSMPTWTSRSRLAACVRSHA